ncbi:type IV secretion system DNA-binding domain-containing protein [Sphingosinithalassobacter sp. LHW66-3]|uniref:type IV secretion system DNA-binding domain-containing protein n=1 Tax=Sphingosinithalassobacter sp. LHW66-3 TaxID=3424718 RepID=UPI003D6A04A2
MKHNLVNFTRGSQLLGHFGFMFAAGLKGPLIVTVLVVLGLGWWEVKTSLSDQQIYLIWMHLYASAYGFMEFDPDKLVNLKLGDGGTASFPISVVVQYPPMREAVAALREALRATLVVAGVVLFPLFVAFWWIAERFGERSKQKKHVRGSSLASLPELEGEIARHNARERAREYGSEMGWTWRLAGRAALREAGLHTPAHLAGVSWPWRREQSHTMLVGTTGTGKTVALTELVDEIRERGERAVIFDLTGAFIETFYEADRDIILNPLDARCPAWSVFNDCASRAEFHSAAESLVPHDGGGSEQFWVLAARTMFVETCIKLAEEGRGTNEALADELMNADLSDLHRLLEDTMAGPITTPSAAKMAESVRAVFNVNAKAMQMLPSDGEPFSIRKWVRGTCERGSLLFLSARYVDMSVLSQLLTLWLDTAINTLMTGRRTRDLKLWFLIDELGALHRLPSLEKGLQTARNFGGAIVTGVHAFAKLKEVYGENMAMTLSSLARTKLILATADRETATWCSDVVGHREVREMEEGYSYGYNNARDAVSLTPRRQVVPLLLPDEFMELPSLTGFIKFPDGFPAAPVTLLPCDRPRLAEGFIARELPSRTRVARCSDTDPTEIREGDDDPTEGDDEGGEPRRLARKERPASDPQTARVRGKRVAQSGVSKSGVPAKRAIEKAPSPTDPAPDARLAARPTEKTERQHHAQSELPLDDAKENPKERGNPSDRLARPDLPDPQAAQDAERDRNRADRRLQEDQQRALLGGVARDRQERDMGDIDPDI